MAHKKNISKKNLIEWYMDFVLEKNHKPKSVFSFAKTNNFEESEFYKYFGSFEKIEESIFAEFFNNTLKILEISKDFENYNARNKLLSFYFTFFEILTANRSYVVHILKGNDNFKNLTYLRELKNKYKKFIDSIGIAKIDFKQEKIEKLQDKSIQETSWIHLLVTLKFWLSDGSPSFEKTDLFIEKSINAQFDLMDIKPMKSIIDFGKFIIKEKVNFN